MRNAKAIIELERTTLVEEVSWRQMREGDMCTKFLNWVANLNRRNNSIESLIFNGTIFFNHFEIKEHIVQFYSSLYIVQFSWWPKLDDLSFDSVGEVEANWLEKERAFEEYEGFWSGESFEQW